MPIRQLKSFFHILTPIGQLLFLIVLFFPVFYLAFHLFPVDYNDGLCFIKETPSNSQDCAVFYDSINDILPYDHYISFKGVAMNVQGGMVEFIKFTSSVLPDNDLTIIQIIDRSGKSVLIDLGHETLKDSGIVPENIVGKTIQVTCFLKPEFGLDIAFLICNNTEIEILESVGNITEYLGYARDYEEVDQYSGFLVGRIDEWVLEETKYITKYNESHLLIYDVKNNQTDILNKYYYANISTTPHSLIDESWNRYGNFSFWFYKISFPKTSEYYTFYERFYSSERDTIFENQEGKPIIFSAYFDKNVYYESKLHNGIIMGELDGSLSFYNIVGDQICGILENEGNSEDCL